MKFSTNLKHPINDSIQKFTCATLSQNHKMMKFKIIQTFLHKNIQINFDDAIKSKH